MMYVQRRYPSQIDDPVTELKIALRLAIIVTFSKLHTRLYIHNNSPDVFLFLRYQKSYTMLYEHDV